MGKLPEWMCRQTITALRDRLRTVSENGAGETRQQIHWALTCGLDEPGLSREAAGSWLRRAAEEAPIGKREVGGPGFFAQLADPEGENELWAACHEVHSAIAEMPVSSSEGLIARLCGEFGLSMVAVAELLDEPLEWVEDIAIGIASGVAHLPRVELAIGAALASVGALSGLLGDDDLPRGPRRKPDGSTPNTSGGPPTWPSVAAGLGLAAVVLVGIGFVGWFGGGNTEQAQSSNEGETVGESIGPRPIAGVAQSRDAHAVVPEYVVKGGDSATTREADVGTVVAGQDSAVADEKPRDGLGPPPGFSDPDGMLPGERVWGRIGPLPDVAEFPLFYEDVALWGDPRLQVQRGRHPVDGSLAFIRTYLVAGGKQVLCGPSRSFAQGKMFDYHASLERESLTSIDQFANDEMIGRSLIKNSLGSGWRIWDNGIMSKSAVYLGASEEVISGRRAALPSYQEFVPGSGRHVPVKDHDPNAPPRVRVNGIDSKSAGTIPTR